MTYWEALDAIENGSLDYAKIQEAYGMARTLIRKEIDALEKAEEAKFREVPVKGPLYGTKPGVLFVDEFCGGIE